MAVVAGDDGAVQASGGEPQQPAVVIAGGGPTGLTLAAELTLAGVDVVVVERRASQELVGSRAGGLHARTIEVLDQRGVAERFVDEGQVMQITGFAGNMMDISDFPTRHNHGLALWQKDFERILVGWAEELGVPIRRSSEVVDFHQDTDGVTVELSDGALLRAQYLVGCDGGRSTVRKVAGIEFPGLDPTTSWILGEVEMEETPPVGMRPEGGGIGPVNRDGTPGPYGVVIKEPVVDDDAPEPTLEDLREALVRVYGSHFGAHSPIRVSRFDDSTRQAATYRSGRVLLAGDAAHIHPPQGGQGLNVGVQDAVNLGWKLAQVVSGASPDSLLDTYQGERHPVGAQVLHNTRAQVALATAGEGHQALRDIVAELLTMDGPRRRIAGMMSGLDVHYEIDGDHPLVGRRMPDLDLEVAGEATRAFALLHEARGVLLDLSGRGGFDVSPWGERVRSVSASCAGPWELPVIGPVAAPDAVLIRPDGHVAWVGDPADEDLPGVLSRWFGEPG